MKQTVVEWLVNEILTEVDKYDDEGNIIGTDYWNAYISCTSLLEYVNKAKEMEKEQVISAYNQGCIDTLKDGMKRGEQYYNETFNK